MNPLPDRCLYIARKVRSDIGVWSHEWDLEVHVPGAAMRFCMPCAGDFATEAPSLEQVWSAIGQAVTERVKIGTPIKSALS